MQLNNFFIVKMSVYQPNGLLDYDETQLSNSLLNQYLCDESTNINHNVVH